MNRHWSIHSIIVLIDDKKESHLPWEDLREPFQSLYERQLWESKKNTSGDNGTDAEGKDKNINYAFARYSVSKHWIYRVTFSTKNSDFSHYPKRGANSNYYIANSWIWAILQSDWFSTRQLLAHICLVQKTRWRLKNMDVLWEQKQHTTPFLQV